MDIIECLIKLGSGVVNSMLETSKRYSNDERLTPEGREYYRELYDGLSVASSNFQDYKEKRNSQDFEKLHMYSIQNLNTMQNNVNALKVRTLVEVYFREFIGKPFIHFWGEPPTYGFFDEDRLYDLKLKIEVIEENMKMLNSNYTITPIFATIGSLIFCEEGIGFALDSSIGKHVLISYEKVDKIVKSRKKSFLSGDEYDIYPKSLNTNLESLNTASFKNIRNDAQRKEIELFARAIVDFIRCFNSNCILEEK